MSRTKRKRGTPLPDWCREKCVWVKDERGLRYECHELTPSEQKAQDSVYHSDTGKGKMWRGQVPKSYRRALNRMKKAKYKAAMKRIESCVEYWDDYSFAPIKSDAGYNWW